MFKSFLLVGLGSFFGGGLRFLVSAAMKSVCAAGFPWGTLAVNLVGCFVIGLLLALFGRWSMLASPWYLLFTTGFCGGFTTFSTFADESLRLLQNGHTLAFIGYVAVSVAAGISLVALGYSFVK